MCPGCGAHGAGRREREIGEDDVCGGGERKALRRGVRSANDPVKQRVEVVDSGVEPMRGGIEAGRLDVNDVIRPIYEEASEALGRKFEYPSK